MTEPPKFSTFSELVTWAVAGAVMLFFTWLTRKLQSSDARNKPGPTESQTEESAKERIAVERRFGVDSEGINDTLVKILYNQDSRLTSNTKEILALRKERDLDHLYIKRMEFYVTDLKDGVMTRRYPPYPDPPTRDDMTVEDLGGIYHDYPRD